MRVLVVDDEVEVVNFLCDFLKRFGLDTEKAHSGRQALEVFGRVKPEWVLLDLKMADIDGLEVLKKMKEINPGVRSMMITGKSDELAESEARSMGVRDYLVKPIDLSELRLKVQKYILEAK